eukprot:scaffold35837_cov30-Tisochrysis_lutea.AAC.3
MREWTAATASLQQRREGAYPVCFGGILVEGEDQLLELVSDEGHVGEVHRRTNAYNQHAIDKLCALERRSWTDVTQAEGWGAGGRVPCSSCLEGRQSPTCPTESCLMLR